MILYAHVYLSRRFSASTTQSCIMSMLSRLIGPKNSSLGKVHNNSVDITKMKRKNKETISVVITVFRSTWGTTQIKWNRHRSFLYGCDRSPGRYVLKLGIGIPNLKQHNWSTKLVWEFYVREFGYAWGRISTLTTSVPKRYQLDRCCLLNSNEHAFIYLFWNQMICTNFTTYFGIIRPTIIFRKKWV